MRHYVYMLLDPRTNLPFYVGKGKDNRYRAHLLPSHRTANKNKKQRIEEIRNTGVEPNILICFSNLEEQDAYDIEVQLIDLFGRSSQGGILTNIARDRRPPGMGGKKHSIETRRSYSETRKGKITATAETRRIMREKRLGFKNHNALIWHVKTPNGESYTIHGGLANWCKTKGFDFNHVYNQRFGFETVREGHGKGGGRKRLNG